MIDPRESEYITQTATEGRARYDNDVRFRNRAQSIVAYVLQRRLPIDPSRPDREVHDIATEVATTLLEAVYRGDAELNGLRQERDHYRKLAEAALANTPLPTFLRAT